MSHSLASRTAAWLKAISGSSGDKDEAILRRFCERALNKVWEHQLTPNDARRDLDEILGLKDIESKSGDGK